MSCLEQSHNPCPAVRYGWHTDLHGYQVPHHVRRSHGRQNSPALWQMYWSHIRYHRSSNMAYILLLQDPVLSLYPLPVSSRPDQHLRSWTYGMNRQNIHYISLYSQCWQYLHFSGLFSHPGYHDRQHRWSIYRHSSDILHIQGRQVLHWLISYIHRFFDQAHL